MIDLELRLWCLTNICLSLGYHQAKDSPHRPHVEISDS